MPGSPSSCLFDICNNAVEQDCSYDPITFISRRMVFATEIIS
jgi:hypothetical protein